MVGLWIGFPTLDKLVYQPTFCDDEFWMIHYIACSTFMSSRLEKDHEDNVRVINIRQCRCLGHHNWQVWWVFSTAGGRFWDLPKLDVSEKRGSSITSPKKPSKNRFLTNSYGQTPNNKLLANIQLFIWQLWWPTEACSSGWLRHSHGPLDMIENIHQEWGRRFCYGRYFWIWSMGIPGS